MKISAEELQKSLEEKLARHRVPGASVAVLHEGVLTTAAAGVTNVRTSVPLTADTVMHIGSITKVFNATLVMQLVDEGRIDLDERVVRYLPDLKIKDRAALEKITVRMLLNHTSGIDGIMLPDCGHDEESLEKAIARFAQLGQLFSPGTEFSYCNAATVIAGYLVQRLRGESWYRLVNERIFAPLKMEHAAALPEEALLHRASVGHFLRPGEQRPVRVSFAFLPLSLGPAGTTLMMSARDLIEFARAHMEAEERGSRAGILSRSSMRAMQQVTVKNQGKGYTYIDMGIGWMVSDDGLLTHAGGAPGVLSVLYAYPEHGFAAAILTNACYSYGLINEFMEPWLQEFGTTRPLGTAAVPSSLPSIRIDPSRYTGTYEDVGHSYSVADTPDGLTLSQRAKFAPYEYTSTDQTVPARLIPLGDDRFFLEPDPEGAVAHTNAFFSLFSFQNPDGRGRMQHLGNTLRLFRRIP